MMTPRAARRTLAHHAAPRPGAARRAGAGLAAAAVLAVAACGADTSTATTGASTTGSSTTSSATASAAASSASTDGSSSTSDSGSTSETISATSEAAQAFLETLTDEQREAVLYDYDDETKTTSWSNFPVTFVERAGLNLSDLTEEQQAAALEVLEGLLSEEAYETVSNIMAGDAYLLEESSTTEDSLGQYYIAFFGEPSDTDAWEVQFGGHHLGINATLQGDEEAITFAPTHLGAQPVTWTAEDGTEMESLTGMYEDAFAFYDSLTEEQRTALYQGSEVSAMECEPGGTCDYPTGTGLSGADLDDEQKQLLLDFLANWVGMSDAETTEAALAEIEATLDETYVSWSGATEYDTSTGDGIYVQVSGPDVYVEMASQNGSAGADVDGVTTAGWGHLHTIYRDPGNDYAGSVEQQESAGMGGGMGGGPNG